MRAGETTAARTLTVATVNVNGIRAAYRRGMAEWLAALGPDVLLLQECRADDDMVTEHLGAGWHLAHQASELKGRAGVTVASRYPATAVRLGLGNGAPEPAVDTGRWAELDIALPGRDRPLTAVSLYVHSGTASDPGRMTAKYVHLDRVTARLATLAAEAAAGERDVLVAGDVNVVRGPLDLKNWKGNHNKTSGVLDPEIAYLERWFGELGLVDVQRAVAGEVQGPYTWWSWRGKAFDNDAGWRIDYQIASRELAARATSARVDRAPAYDQRFSDHAPVVVTYDL